MSWQQLAEECILKAIADGAFDNLPGHGQPLDLSDYFSMPAADRMGHAILKHAGFAPPEVELLREIGGLEARVNACADPESRKSLARELEACRVKLAMKMERRRLAARANRSFDVL